jgi:predicted secreted protein
VVLLQPKTQRRVLVAVARVDSAPEQRYQLRLVLNTRLRSALVEPLG